MNEKTRNLIRRRIIIALAIIGTILFTVYIYLANAIKIYELDQQKIQISQQIENEKIRSNQLDEQVKQMGSKNYVENFARRYLGLYYPDETIVIVETQKDAAESDGQTVEQ
ncbi:septum formation initiator family protein [Acetobacterium wieringae]|uniref:septum formation initiator family protein n=1 Tax=Acetobacterium wieringae TaxID=52694 RepID=UPI0026EB76E7|nr:septum formation initiator family protein [Acetobacterium wieringae]